MCRACWETNKLTRAGGFLSRTVGSFATQEKLRTHTTSQKTINRKGEPMVCKYLNRIGHKKKNQLLFAYEIYE